MMSPCAFRNKLQNSNSEATMIIINVEVSKINIVCVLVDLKEVMCVFEQTLW